jgi:AraC family transcriptional regulator, chitin signaling transcriptional activator
MPVQRILLLLCVWYWIVPTTQAQQISHFTKEDGLPSDLIKSIAVDGLGFIWLATDEGLIRFDGKNYKHFLAELPSPYVKYLFKRKNGQLLATTDLGLVEIENLANPTIKVLLKGKPEASEELLSYPKLMYEDQQGRLWIGDNWHLVALQNGKFKHYKFPAKDKTGHFQRSFSVFEVGKDVFTFSNTGFLYKYAPEKDAFEELAYPKAVTNIFHAIQIPRTQRAVFSSAEGVFEFTFDEKSEVTAQKLISADLDVSYLFHTDSLIYASSWTKGLFGIDAKRDVRSFNLPTNNISSIIASGNNILLASDNGLLTIHKRTFAPHFQDLTNGYIQSFYKKGSQVYYTDGDKVIEVGKNYQPNLLYKSKFGVLLGLVKRGENIILSDTKGYILQLTGQNATLLKDLSSKGKAIFSAFLDSKQRIWFCQDSNAELICLLPNDEVKFYGKAQGITANPLMVKESPEGKVYCGATKDDGFLFVLDEAQDTFQNLSQKVDFQHNEPIITNDIAFQGNRILVGSSFGLLIYENGKFTRKNLGDMTHDAVKAVTVDARQDIWVANSKGLLKLVNDEILLFDELQGLPSKGISYRSLLADDSQKMWVGTFNGVGVMQDITRFYKTPSPLIINVSAPVGKQGIYQIYKNGFLQIEYVSNVLPQKQVRYQIKLNGKWQDMGYKTSLLLSDLETGTYRLQIRAKQNGNYIWSDSCEIVFEVVQVWYFTWWGIAFLLIALIVLVLALIRLNSWNHKKTQKRLEKVIEARTNELTHKNEVLETQKIELQTILKDLKETQNQLIHSEKMASLGQLVASVAHEINTPLGAIRSSVVNTQNALKETLEDLPTFLLSLGEAERETFKSTLHEILNAQPTNLSTREKRQMRNQIKEALEARNDAHAFDIAEIASDLGVQFDFLAHKALNETPRLFEMMKMLHNITTVQASNQNIQDATNRASKIIFALKNFSRQDLSEEKVTANINETIETVLTVYQSQLKQGIEVVRNFADLPTISCYPDELVQVWTNLIHNAMYAMAGKGTLTIESKLVGEKLQVSVADTGAGIPADIQDKIFNAFFTTKKLGEGSGLGLDIVKKIIDKHAGKIWLESEVGKGTTFFVEIPM